jgi:hypothetical protein
MGWFDDFSHSGVNDALGGGSRAAAHVNLPTNIGAFLPQSAGLHSTVVDLGNGQAISLNQRNRCPGAIERGTVYKPGPSPYWPDGYPCDDKQVPLGP